jgi:hypothetical protein
MSELSPEQKNVTVDPTQRYVETAGEITAFLTALEEQIKFLKVIASQKAIDSEVLDQNRSLSVSKA